MTTTAAVLTILAGVLPLLIYLVRRRLQKSDDPRQQNLRRREEIAREIVRDDERGANRSLDDDLQRLRALQSDKRGPAGPPPEGRS